MTSSKDKEILGLCGLCGRDLIAGPSVNRHHLVPKTFGGKEAVWIHRVCHSKIHSLFSERELLKLYHNFEALLRHEEIIKFVKWVRKKDPEYYSKNKRAQRRR